MARPPSFDGLRPASVNSSKAKRGNKRVDTWHELLLRRELWRIGLRYRKHVKDLPGTPDLVFRRARVVVFCDGDFWHGRNWRRLRCNLDRGTNAEYWTRKIAANIKRDVRITSVLKQNGWRVVRMWETDILRDATSRARLIKKVVDSRLNSKVRRARKREQRG